MRPRLISSFRESVFVCFCQVPRGTRILGSHYSRYKVGYFPDYRPIRLCKSWFAFGSPLHLGHNPLGLQPKTVVYQCPSFGGSYTPILHPQTCKTFRNTIHSLSHLFQVGRCLQGRSVLNATSGLTCLDSCPLGCQPSNSLVSC